MKNYIELVDNVTNETMVLETNNNGGTMIMNENSYTFEAKKIVIICSVTVMQIMN